MREGKVEGGGIGLNQYLILSKYFPTKPIYLPISIALYDEQEGNCPLVGFGDALRLCCDSC